MQSRTALEVPLPCQANLQISVFHAAKPAAPILLYLPPGPVLPEFPEEEERVISTLREASAATVVRINYRASPEHQYPTPCHDVLLGYDWVRDHLLVDEFQRPYLARLGVCGELVGGSLATMLGLTECRLGESRIVAAAVNNPLVDWVFPDELPAVRPEDLPEPLYGDETALLADEDLAGSYASEEKAQPGQKPQKKRAPKAPPPTAWQTHGDNSVIPTLTLSGERDVLFRKPEDYFDRFASPMHFFRSPHAQLLYPQQDYSTTPQDLDELLDMEAQLALSHYATFENYDNFNAKAPPELPTLSRCRAYARNYPPAGTRLSLPVWNVTIGLQSPLSDTTLELAKMLRRSIARQTLKTHSGRSRWHDAAEKKRYEEYAHDRVQLNSYQGVALWTQQDDNPKWEQHVQQVGTWMKERLDPAFT
ncbi:Alpha beta hydrolase fold-3 [Pyrenophora seminiperda CCB06]|uniref:Alpha beta hydrolase fold-3 n=1 Tax=Pyrenophora seminiperda CCB06 TaxID=1302712 RepID=A0A3M7M1V4_9PLEO|nr:Alpha beta hydrolase fold-3 [Pyrenophora seminiperda CCB06]